MSTRLLLAVGVPTAIAILYFAQVGSHRFLVDDAFISFRYATHWEGGLGPVWNPAERVEGYTNFLWVALLALGLRVGAAPEVVSVVVGVTCGAGVLLGIAAYAAGRTGWRDPWIWAAPALLVSNRSFVAWSTGGLETMAYTFLTCGGLALAVVGRAGTAGLLLALGALTRPEGVLPIAIGALWLAIVRRRDLVRFVAPGALLVGAHTAFRLGYYGDVVPNTFHAKVDGLQLAQAWRYLALLHHDTGIGFVAPLLLVPLLVRRSAADALSVAVLGTHVVYLCWIGGDIFEFRMIVPVLPIAALALADAIRGNPGAVPERRTGGSAPRAPRIRWGVGRVPVGRVLAVAVIVALCAGQHVLAARTRGAPVRAGISSIGSMRAYTRARVREGRRLDHLVENGVLPSDLRIATAGAGAVPYLTDLYTVDVLGLNDAVVARSEPLPRTRPGHHKRASRGHLAECGIDMLDVSGGFLFRGPRPGRAELGRANRRLKRFNRTDGEERLRLRCRRVPGGHLLFASPLGDEAFQARFGHLSECDAPTLVAAVAAAGPLRSR